MRVLWAGVIPLTHLHRNTVHLRLRSLRLRSAVAHLASRAVRLESGRTTAVALGADQATLSTPLISMIWLR